MKSQKIHQVILTEGSRASIIQTPRLGILGWNKNSLVLGLELLLILSPEQAKAVLAHELGHLSNHCNRFNAWVSRQRLIGYNIMQAYKQKGNFTARVISCFFGWYAPRFAAYSFVLARANEYEADALSAQSTSAHLIGHALVNIHVMNSYLKCHYWQEFLKQADESPVPKQLPWKGLPDFLNTHWPTGEQFKEYLDKELQQKTHHYDDVHPALGDRINALGVSMPFPHAPQTSAALAWCGEDKLQQIISDFDAHWVQVYQAHWQKRYQYVTESKERLSHLKEKADSELTHEELLEKITLIIEFESESEALSLSLLKDYQSRCPDNPEVAFRLGIILYKQNDEACLEQFKIALSQDQLAIYACMCAYFFLENKNRTKEMRWWKEETHIQMQIIEKQKKLNMQIAKETQLERSVLSFDDEFTRANIDVDLLNHIIIKLKSYKQVNKAWIARKQVQHAPEIPALVIVVTLKTWFISRNRVMNKILKDFVDLTSCSVVVLPRAGIYKRLAKEIARIGEQII